MREYMNNFDALWQQIEIHLIQYRNLNLASEIDYQKFYLYSLITHSTAIEGSTLTELDIQLLFDDGITANGKPLEHHLMNRDLKNAYMFAMQEAQSRTPITVDFLQSLNAKTMKSTGGMYSTSGGVFDSSKGDFRLCGVTAGYGGSSYMDYKKVPESVAELCIELNKRITESTVSEKERYLLSFDAHFNLVTIHPWVDGNGRTARLLMNYIQFLQKIIPVKVYKEDKADYITALIESREKETIVPFHVFMANQLLKMLKEEINKR
jgi:Fic family protein